MKGKLAEILAKNNKNGSPQAAQDVRGQELDSGAQREPQRTWLLAVPLWASVCPLCALVFSLVKLGQ